MTNKTKKQLKAEYDKAYNLKNKEKKKQQRLDNKDNKKEYDRQHYLKNRERKLKYCITLYEENRIKAIEQLGGVCSHPGCNCTEDLQFNHINPADKLYETSSLLSGKLFINKRLQDELIKCNLLCKKHHKEETSRQWKEGLLR